MTKIKIEIDIPDYNVKYCDDVWYGSRCRFLEHFSDGFRHFCSITGKEITITKGFGRVCRPYGCRCLAKKEELNINKTHLL